MSEHMNYHIEKINKLISFCLDNDIKSFAYGYSQNNYSNIDYWSVIEYYQKICNADNNNEFIFFYAEDENKRKRDRVYHSM